MAGQDWPAEAYALAKRGRGLNELRLQALIDEIQVMTGRRRRECAYFVLRYSSERKQRHRYSEEEIDLARELLAVNPVNEVAQKLGRSKESLLQMCKRQGIRIREVQCDFFTVATLAKAVGGRKTTVKNWIQSGYLKASNGRIDPEAVAKLIEKSLPDLSRLGHPKAVALIHLWSQHCYAPKHASGNGDTPSAGNKPGRSQNKQLLQVRSAKKEHAAYEAQLNLNAGMDPDI